MNLQQNPYAALFGNDGDDTMPYLNLLSLADETKTAKTLDQLGHARTLPGARAAVAELLTDDNWRSHLVGGVAFLFAGEGELDVGWLWNAIDARSWVTPQLTVLAWFFDTHFVDKASARIEACATGASSPPGLPASLIALCSLHPALAAHVEQWRVHPQLSERLHLDAKWDKSDRIALQWMEALRRHAAARGIALAPAADATGRLAYAELAPRDESLPTRA